MESYCRAALQTANGVFSNTIVRIMKGSRYTHSCKSTFKALVILAVPAQFRPIIPLMAFTAHNLEHFTLNFTVHGINRINKLHHRPITNLTFYKRVYYASKKTVIN
jgi:hypothetical protein